VKGGGDVYLIKTNSLGDTAWTKTYGDISADVGYSVQQTSDGGYIITGYITSSLTGNTAICLIKTDGSGNALWTKTYKESSSFSEVYGTEVQQTKDGGYIVVGYIDYGLIELIKTDDSGDTLWTSTGDGSAVPTYFLGYAYSVRQTPDGGYIVAGYTDYDEKEINDDVYLIKMDASGNRTWTKRYGGTRYERGKSVRLTSDGGYIIAGRTDSYGAGAEDIYLIKIKPEEGGIEEEITTGLFSLSTADPNPFTTKTTVKYELAKSANVNISIYNMLGQKVKDIYSGKKSSGVHSVSWNGTKNSGEKASSGTYLLKIEAEGKEGSTKLMFMR